MAVIMQPGIVDPYRAMEMANKTHSLSALGGKIDGHPTRELLNHMIKTNQRWLTMKLSSAAALKIYDAIPNFWT